MEPYQPVFDRFPTLKRFPTDDIIVLLNGEKTNSVSFENHLSQHPDIEGATMFSNQMFEAGVLVELKFKSTLSPEDKINYIEKLWPTIQETNQDSPAHARILYSQTVNDLYQLIESSRTGPFPDEKTQVDLDDLDALIDVVQKACKESTALGDGTKNDDSLARGIDSLQIPTVDLKSTTIYFNSTPVALAKAIQTAARGLHISETELESERRSGLERTLEPLFRRVDQLAGTQTHKVNMKQNGRDPHVCIVTGTTDSIGAYILRSLMENDSDAATRQPIHNAEADPQLPTTFPKAVHFLKAELAHDTFGLEPTLFGKLSSSATLIGVLKLCKFSAQIDYRPPIMFLPSISAIMNLALDLGEAVPGRIFDDPLVPVTGGYGESKYVAERIFDYAAKSLSIPVFVARIFQVYGATRSPGKWNPKERIPCLILGSVSLGAIPDSLSDYDTNIMDVDWIPADLLASAIIEILLKGTSRAGILLRISKALERYRIELARGRNLNETPITVVSPQDWLRKLRGFSNNLDVHQNKQDISSTLRLLDFYENKPTDKVCPQWDMQNSTSTSITLRQAVSIGPKDIEN
ncbi:hypothetical protein F4810DRAFT_725159 [Camillea tinctor]|nr:hypothetical protein F4810DRAFT_725159 [Camillea tinctor]